MKSDRFKELKETRAVISFLERRISSLEEEIRKSDDVAAKITMRSTLESNKELLKEYKKILEKEELLIL